MDLPAITPQSTASGAKRPVAPSDDERAGRAAAEAFESAFISEMLKYGGVNKTPEGWGGGAGEDAFGSFLTEEYGRLISAKGGLGLAEQIFNAMQGKASGT